MLYLHLKPSSARFHLQTQNNDYNSNLSPANGVRWGIYLHRSQQGVNNWCFSYPHLTREPPLLHPSPWVPLCYCHMHDLVPLLCRVTVKICHGDNEVGSALFVSKKNGMTLHKHWYGYNIKIIIIIIIKKCMLSYILFATLCMGERNWTSSASEWGCGAGKEAKTSIARAGGMCACECVCVLDRANVNIPLCVWVCVRVRMCVCMCVCW